MINNKEKLKKLKEAEYQQIFGVKKKTFEKMLAILERQYKKDHKRGGSKPKVSVLDRLVMMLSYYREYRAMGNMAFDYEVSKSTVWEGINWAEKSLIKSGEIPLPKKRIEEDYNGLMVVDVTENEIERPKKNSGCGIVGKRSGIR